MSRQTWTGAGSATVAAAFSMMSSWSGRVDHHGDRGGRCRVTGQPGERRPVGGRVGDHDVVADALPGQPERLRQGEGQDPAEPVQRQDLLEHARGSAPTCWPAGSACPPPAGSCPAALARSAARSTTANGGSRCAVAAL